MFLSFSPRLSREEVRQNSLPFHGSGAQTARRTANCASSQSLCDFLQFVCRNSKTNWRRTSARARRSAASVPDTCRCRTDVQPYQPALFPSILNGSFHLSVSLKRVSTGCVVHRLCSLPPLMKAVDLVSCLSSSEQSASSQDVHLSTLVFSGACEMSSISRQVRFRCSDVWLLRPFLEVFISPDVCGRGTARHPIMHLTLAIRRIYVCSRRSLNQL